MVCVSLNVALTSSKQSVDMGLLSESFPSFIPINFLQIETNNVMLCKSESNLKFYQFIIYQRQYHQKSNQFIYIIFQRTTQMHTKSHQTNTVKLLRSYFLLTAFMIAFYIKQTLSPNPIGIPTNTNFQTGIRTLMSTGTIKNTALTFSIIFSTPMASPTVSSAIGITGLDYTLRKKDYGFDIIIITVDQNGMTLQVESVRNNDNNITYVKICYLVSDHPQIDIDYFNITYASPDSVFDTDFYDDNYTQNWCKWTSFQTYCRKKQTTLSYNAKLTGNNIKARVFMAGFYVKDDRPNTGVTNTPSDFFGLQFMITSVSSTTFVFALKLYQWFQLSSISFFIVSYQQKTITSTIQTWIYNGQGTVGCYYQNNSCGATTPTADGTFDTNSMRVDMYSEHVYFIGISRIFVDYDFSSTDKKGDFEITSTYLSGNTVWRNAITFSGNTNFYHRLTFSYIALILHYCNQTGANPYMHISRTSCQSNCNNTIQQYFDANNYCQSCGPICYKCTGSATQCTACYASQFRVVSSNTCVCDVGYYDNTIDLICKACHVSCRTCFQSTESSCLTCESSDFRSFDGVNSCPCKAKYYHAGASTCATCHIVCQTCFGAGNNQCLSCVPSSHLVLATNNVCSCEDGFYYVGGTQLCAACHYSCATCNTVSTNCTSCNTTAFREYDSANRKCNCKLSYYDQGAAVKAQICLLCEQTCKACTGPANSDCTSCDATKNRFLVLGYCICDPKYFQQTTTKTCIPCHYTCYNCTSNSQPNSCINCNYGLTHRLYLASKQCICQDGFVDAGNGNPVCQACNYTCATCQVSPTNCTSCSTSLKRQFLGNTCPCIYGYVDVLLTGACSKCHYSCQTCVGVGRDKCLTCDTTVRLFNPSSGQCQCFSSFYDNLFHEQCQPCSYECLQCSDGYNSTCTACDSITEFRVLNNGPVGTCQCDTGYYELPANALNPQICQPCDIRCQTCSLTPTKCLTCKATTQFRQISIGNICSCSPGYYDVGSPICLPCILPCTQCSITGNNCTACDETLYYFLNNDCFCKNGTFLNVSISACQACHYSCQTCSDSTQAACGSCNSLFHRVLFNATCICSPGYYDNISAVCTKCPYSCQNCTIGASPTSIPFCTSCPLSSLRTLSSNQCGCPQRTYDDGFNPTCQSCSAKCYNCSISFSLCLSCHSSQNRILGGVGNNNCVCLSRYYEPINPAAVNYVCQSCHYSCLTCSDSLNTSCLTCSSIQNRTYQSRTCPCANGFFAVGTSCVPCHYTCLTCSISANNCTSCDYSLSKILATPNICVCRPGTYQNGADCSICDVLCETCITSSSNCLSCNISHGSVLNGNLCECPPNQFRNITLQCNGCHSTCDTCSGLLETDCLSCSPAKNRRLSGTTCICDLNFYSNLTSGTCLPCHTQCLTCFGGTQLNCSSCDTVAGYTLVATTCIKHKTCSNYYYQGTCINVCPITTYPLNNQCKNCQNHCKTCTSSTYCLTCDQTTYFRKISNTCEVRCPLINQYIDYSTLSCQTCPLGCKQCLFSQTAGNSILCKECSSGYYLYNYTTCLLGCPAETHVVKGMHCYPCIGNCLKCTDFSPNSCYLCKNDFFLFEIQKICLKNCPQGYYADSKTKKCQICKQNCDKCLQNSCLKCKNGYYLVQKTIDSYDTAECMKNRYFYDQKSSSQIQCHPNCQSCTDRSFSSCISCSKNRGDGSQMAISGYCQCHLGSIDLGDGTCDFQSYRHIQQSNKALVSIASSGTFFAGLASITSLNFLPSIFVVLNNQAYSTMFYLNSSAVLQTDSVLAYYSKYNPTNFLKETSQVQNQLTESRRLRLLSELSIQSDQSLFMRGSQFKYLSQWAFSILIILLASWIILGLVKYIIYKVWDQQSQDISQDTVKTKKTISKCQKYTKRISKYLLESLFILIHLFTITSIALYATACFKIILIGIISIDWFHLIASVIMALYYIAYLIRLIVGVCLPQSYKNPSLSVLFHFFRQKAKLSFIFRLYVPLIMVRNGLAAVLIVVFSLSPETQILSNLIIYGIFLLYSIIFNPYFTPFRIFLTIQEIILFIQMIVLSISVNSVQTERITPAIVLLGLNFASAIMMFFFSLVVLCSMRKDSVCSENHNKIAIQNGQQQANLEQAKQVNFNLTNDQLIQEKQKANCPNKNQESQEAFQIIDFQDSKAQDAQFLQVQDVPLPKPEKILKKYRIIRQS